MTVDQRIESLDGLRGLAIIMVILFHAYAGHEVLIPWAYGAGLQPVAQFGWLGVELFFLISGFVILMSLEKCPTFLEFLHRRWIRLFPAMLIATLLVVATAPVLHERPLGQPQWIDTIWGLILIDPEIFKVFGLNFRPVEGVLWSLFVEVKFYLIFGAFYFVSPAKSVAGLMVLFLSAFTYKVVTHAGVAPRIRAIDTLLFTVLSLQYFGWFCVGALLNRYHVTRSPQLLFAAIIVLMPALLATAGSNTAVMAVSVGIFGLFLAAIFTRRGAVIFSSRILVLTGFISFPLYLIHENAMVALTIQAHALGELLPAGLTPLPGLIVVVLISYLIAAYLEPNLRRRLSLRLRIVTPTESS